MYFSCEKPRIKPRIQNGRERKGYSQCLEKWMSLHSRCWFPVLPEQSAVWHITEYYFLQTITTLSYYTASCQPNKWLWLNTERSRWCSKITEQSQARYRASLWRDWSPGVGHFLEFMVTCPPFWKILNLVKAAHILFMNIGTSREITCGGVWIWRIFTIWLAVCLQRRLYAENVQV
jgi:hypothetical protein